jgi:hypothetical protein
VKPDKEQWRLAEGCSGRKSASLFIFLTALVFLSFTLVRNSDAQVNPGSFRKGDSLFSDLQYAGFPAGGESGGLFGSGQEIAVHNHVAKAVSQQSLSGVLALFRTDAPVLHDKAEKIEINPVHPPGLIYRIQVAVFRNPVTTEYFKGLAPVYGIRNPGTGMTTYYAGMFRKADDARAALVQVREKGFRDAFLVPFSGGRPVTMERARILEKEWGVIPFTPDEAVVKDIEADTVPPTLSFRVEVIRSMKPVGEGVYDEMKKLSGSRGLDVETLPDGMIVYLIGNFITYQSAVDYADLLVRNGYREAKVAAWLGKKEIPVETAKQLFNSLK